MFSKKQYEEIAKVISDETNAQGASSSSWVRKRAGLIIRFCRLFAKDNPKFNRAKFVKACE